jgi:hypothetical protein
MASQLHAFLSGDAPDRHGRYAADVIGMSDDELERHHDWVQWLFPLPTPSAAVPGSPVLSPAESETMKSDARVRDNLRTAADRLIEFYSRTDYWLTAHDHNHLRITRIIRSLGLLLGSEDARRFYESVIALQEAAGATINAQSLRYWRQALETH